MRDPVTRCHHALEEVRIYSREDSEYVACGGRRMRAVKERVLAVSQAVDIGRHISVGKVNGERRGSQSPRGHCPPRRRRSCVRLGKARTPLA